ncbi:pilus assembly protein N-terminal domain-containing protein [Stieleria marina]|uniref:pilus assembly protein N-terminal domain-containing protein n=1 Tax=Stieleria marina TaxID=1930275 RepID=UPI003AF37BE9
MPSLLPPVQTPVQPTGADSNRSHLQEKFPQELYVQPTSEQARIARRNETRFIPTSIDPELVLKLVAGRPKILQLTEPPVRIYTPADTIIRTEIIDEQSGKEVAVTGLNPGTTTLIFWFEDQTAPNGQTHVAYKVDVPDYAD